MQATEMVRFYSIPVDPTKWMKLKLRSDRLEQQTRFDNDKIVRIKGKQRFILWLKNGFTF